MKIKNFVEDLQKTFGIDHLTTKEFLFTLPMHHIFIEIKPFDQNGLLLESKDFKWQYEKISEVDIITEEHRLEPYRFIGGTELVTIYTLYVDFWDFVSNGTYYDNYKAIHFSFDRSNAYQYYTMLCLQYDETHRYVFKYLPNSTMKEERFIANIGEVRGFNQFDKERQHFDVDVVFYNVETNIDNEPYIKYFERTLTER